MTTHPATAVIFTGRASGLEQTIYGMGAKALADKRRTSFGQDLDESEATDIRRRYLQAYRGIRNSQQLQGRKAETTSASPIRAKAWIAARRISRLDRSFCRTAGRHR